MSKRFVSRFTVCNTLVAVAQNMSVLYHTTQKIIVRIGDRFFGKSKLWCRTILGLSKLATVTTES